MTNKINDFFLFLWTNIALSQWHCKGAHIVASSSNSN